jgi:hypothetical protein
LYNELPLSAVLNTQNTIEYIKRLRPELDKSNNLHGLRIKQGFEIDKNLNNPICKQVLRHLTKVSR